MGNRRVSARLGHDLGPETPARPARATEPARRSGAIAVALATVLGGLTLSPWDPTSGAATPAYTASLANGHDDLKTSWYPEQSALTPALVTGGTFGQMWDASIDVPADRYFGADQVYGQPLVHTAADGSATVVVATEANTLYGFDATTGARKYKVVLGEAYDPNSIPCADLAPRIGITGTPAIDPTSGTAYVLSKQTAGAGAKYVAYGYDAATGAVQWSTEIAGAAQNAPGTTFDAAVELQRPGLLINQGVLYAAFGGHCDKGDYRGWVVGIDLATHQIVTMWAAQPAGTAGSGIWQSGGGIMSDGPGRLFVATGNAMTGAPYAGQQPIAASTPPSVLGEAVVRLDVQPDRSLRAGSFFMPYDALQLDQSDLDFGSSGPVAIPAEALPPGQRGAKVLVAVGKEGYVYLLDRDNLGGYKQGTGGGDLAVDRVGPDGGAWTKPAVWPGESGDGGYVYIVSSTQAQGGGPSGSMNAYRVVDAGSHPALQKVGGADQFAFGSGAAIVTSVGTTPGSGIVWSVWSPGQFVAAAELRAYGAIPDGSGVLPLLGRFPVGLSNKFGSPVASGNRIFVPTRDGHLYAFGSPIDQPLSVSTPTFVNTVVGTGTTVNVTVTANTAATVTALTSTSGAFAVGNPSPALPASLAAGASLTVPVTFAPGAVGPVSGRLQVSADVGPASVPLSGRGLAAGGSLGANPVALSLGGAPIGSSISGAVLLTNSGASALTISAIDGQAEPFTVATPSLPYTLASGASVQVGVTFDAASGGNFAIELHAVSDGGSVTVPVTASAATPGHRAIAPGALEFADTLVGGHRTRAFTLGNDGASPFTVTISKPPVAGAFAAAPGALPEGTTVDPGGLRVLPVRFAPTAAGPQADSWDLSTSDGSGRTALAVRGSALASVSVAPDATWLAHADAVVAPDGGLTLTPDAPDRLGAAWYPAPIATDHVEAHFVAELDGAAEAPGDGLTFALADATQLTTTATGGGGQALGFGGIPGAVGVAITSADAEGSNLVGVVAAQADGSRTWLAPPVSISPDLHGGGPGARPVPVDVWIDRDSAGTARITVRVDATPVVVDLPVEVPARAFVGFTAATSGRYERHAIAPGATILAGGFATASCPDAVSGWKGELFVGTEPGTGPIACRDDATIAFDWGAAAPAAGLPADGFSARWTRTIATGARTYTFVSGSDDGSRLYVDGRLVLNAWKQQTYTPRSVRVPLTAGLHTIVFEYFDATGPARAQLSIR